MFLIKKLFSKSEIEKEAKNMIELIKSDPDHAVVTHNGKTWLKAELSICDRYAKEISKRASNLYGEKCLDYLTKAREIERKPTPLMIWILIFSMVVIEAFGFSYILAGYVIPGVSENEQRIAALGISFLVSILLVFFTHQMGRELYKNSLIKDINDEFKRDPNPTDWNRDKIYIDNADSDKSKPLYHQTFNRIRVGTPPRKSYGITFLTVLLISIVALGALYVRNEVIKTPGLVENPKAAWMTFLILTAVFVFLQIMGIIFGKEYGFAGIESKKAYKYLKNIGYTPKIKSTLEKYAEEQLDELHIKIEELANELGAMAGYRALRSKCGSHKFADYYPATSSPSATPSSTSNPSIHYSSSINSSLTRAPIPTNLSPAPSSSITTAITSIPLDPTKYDRTLYLNYLQQKGIIGGKMRQDLPPDWQIYIVALIAEGKYTRQQIRNYVIENFTKKDGTPSDKPGSTLDTFLTDTINNNIKTGSQSKWVKDALNKPPRQVKEKENNGIVYL